MLDISNSQILENIGEDVSDKELNDLFNTLFKEVEKLLDLEPFHRNVKIRIKDTIFSKTLRIKNIFDIGANRYIKDNIIIIEIDKYFLRFLKFIFFREILNLFAPEELRANEMVQITINRIILTQLAKSPLLNQWRSLIRENIDDCDLLSTGVNRFFSYDRYKFFKLNKEKTPQYSIQFFFRYLRENRSLISNKTEHFDEILFEEFSKYMLELENSNDIIETIRCLIEIFYKVKNYTSILDYKHYFQEFRDNGEIESELSQRRFSKSMDWIKEKSYIAPSYQLNWNTINASLISVFLRFHPLLNKAKIDRVINELPFFISPKVSFDSFAVDLAGYIVIPQVYLNDFKGFIKKLEDFGYIIKQYCLLWNTNRHSVNLNYLREYSKNYRIINPEHSLYEVKNEINFTTDLGNDNSNYDFSLLDFLVLDRIRFYSISGLGFERMNDTIRKIKSDLINGIIAERVKIKNLRNILKKFYDSNDLSTEFLQFLDQNKNFGFFYIKNILDKAFDFMKLIDNICKKHPNIRTYSAFQAFIRKEHFSQLIEENLLLKKKSHNKTALKELIILYWKSKKLYKKRISHLQKFSELINSCYNLKIFNLNSIKKMVIDQTIVDKIYKSKEVKLKKHYEKWKPYKITYQKIESIIDKFLSNDPPIIKPLLINTLIFQEKDYLQLVLVESEETHRTIDMIKKFFPRILINTTTGLESKNNLLYVEISTPHMYRKEKEQFYSILYNNLKKNLLYGKSYMWKGWNYALSRKNFYNFDSKQFFYTKDLFPQFFLNVQRILGDSLKLLPKNNEKSSDIFWSKEKYFSRLLNVMNYNDKKENIDLSILHLTELLNFNKNLTENLLDLNEFKIIKDKYFYKNHIKSIKCIPLLQHFGLQEFFIYVYPLDVESIDLKILLSNTFQKIKYPICIDQSNSLLIKYV
ncbi:MAG: hypothetical protein ACFFCV_15585, partial [Promethearchaeota archaeon]